MFHCFGLAARWVLVLAVFYAPWAFGCTNFVTNLGLAMFLGGAFLFWAIFQVGERSFPSLPPVLVVTSLAILVFGWWMALNAHYLHDDQYRQFMPIACWARWLPGSYEKTLSVEMMWRVSALVGTIWMVVDVSKDPVWRKRLWMAVGLAGGTIALWGLIQRTLDAPSIFWMQRDHGIYFFSTFRNHSNAGAYLNLVLPVIAGLLVVAMRRRGKYLERALWAAVLMVVLAAALINTSRGAQIVTALLAVIFLIWRWRAIWDFFGRMSKPVLIGAIVSCVLVLGVVATSVGWQTSVRRWQWLPRQLASFSHRAPAYRAWTTILPESGWFGMGPGTFRSISPHFMEKGGPDILKKRWDYAHQDYLQTLIEWGYVGTLLWGIVYLGGAWRAWHYWHQTAKRRGSESRFLLGCVVLAFLGVCVHALYDFPLQIGSVQFYTTMFLAMMWSSPDWTNGNRGRTTLGYDATEAKRHEGSA